MGIDVQKKAQKSFEQHVDAAVEEVSTPDLFDQEPKSCARRFLADPVLGSKPIAGQEVDFELQGGSLIGVQGQTLLFRADRPPSDVVAHVRAKGGVAEGKIAAVNTLSDVLEIELC